MVWYRYQEVSEGVFNKKKVFKSIVKFDQKTNQPDPNYFGGPLWTLLNQPEDFDEFPMVFCEAFPRLKVKQEIESDRIKSSKGVFSNFVRDFSLVKNLNEKQVHIFLGSESQIDLENFTRSLDCGDSRPIPREAEPDFLKNLKTIHEEGQYLIIPFDISLSHQLNFVKFQERQESLVNSIIRTISDQNSGVWIQFVFKDLTGVLGKIAEYSGTNISRLISEIRRGGEATRFAGLEVVKGPISIPVPKTRIERIPHVMEGSTVHQIGMNIVDDYFSKSHSTLVGMSVRGVIISKDMTLINNIESVFRGLKQNSDVFQLSTYESTRIVKLLRSRQISNERSITQLQINGSPEVWKNTTWGIYRDYSNILCLTPDEVRMIGVDMPTDNTLTVKFKRSPDLTPQFTNKSGFSLGLFER